MATLFSALILIERIIAMINLLRIDASPRGGESHSRRIGDRIEAALVATSITRRDLAAMPVPHLDGATITGFFSPADAMTEDLKAATALSDAIIGEVEAADLLLMTIPMFNFGVPSVVKAWIDQLVRVNRSFAYDGTNFDGLLKGKRAYVVIAYGAAGYAAGQPLSSADFVKPFVDFVLRFIGFSEVSFVTLDGTNAGTEALAMSQADVERQLIALFPSATDAA
jgi:FMN-dependent NADH-azoreductase